MRHFSKCTPHIVLWDLQLYNKLLPLLMHSEEETDQIIYSWRGEVKEADRCCYLILF